MARANLTVNDEVVDAFKAAQEQGSSVRFLKVQIEDGKEELSLASSQPRNAGPAEDFEDLVVPALESDKACIIVFRVSAGDEDASTVFEGAGAGVPWMMVCWTPESAKVREKMLYSSSREDLKESLGRALITQEFVATAADEVSWASYLKSVGVDDEKFLTEKEELLAKEAHDNHITVAETSGSGGKANVMGQLPFHICKTEIPQAVEALQANNETCTMLELYLSGEEIHLSKTHADIPLDTDSFKAFVNTEVGRFYIVKTSKGLYFVFSCPESTPVRERMTLSTAKATVVQALGVESGLEFSKIMEIREAAELDEYLPEKEEKQEAEGGIAGTSAGAKPAHVRPAKPTRRPTAKKISKFVADEN